MDPSSSSSSSSGWTKVGKGGKPVEFPPEAAAAFGSKKRAQPFANSIDGRADFPEEASAAFSRSAPLSSGAPRRPPFDTAASTAFSRSSGAREPRRAPPSVFDEAAASAFGSKPRGTVSTGGGGGGGFDERASAAFGGRGSAAGGGGRGDFPSAFGGKPRSGFGAAAAELGFDDAESDGRGWTMSAFGKKKAEAIKPGPPKKQTYEELFPVLGATGGAPVAPTSAPAAAPSAKGWGAKASGPSFADVMKKRVAIEEAEAEEIARYEREMEELRQQEAYDRRMHRAIRTYRPVNTVAFTSEVEAGEESAYTTNDLDHDAYGEIRKDLRGPEVPDAALSSEDEGEGEEADAEVY